MGEDRINCQYCKQEDCSGSCEQYEEVMEIERQALEDDYHYGRETNATEIHYSS
jgi:hypothetical protein